MHEIDLDQPDNLSDEYESLCSTIAYIFKDEFKELYNDIMEQFIRKTISSIKIMLECVLKSELALFEQLNNHIYICNLAKKMFKRTYEEDLLIHFALKMTENSCGQEGFMGHTCSHVDRWREKNKNDRDTNEKNNV